MNDLKVLHNSNRNNIPLQFETLMFRKLLHECLSLNKFNNFSNLNECQLKLLFDFIKEKPFIIVNSDKNVGFVILKKELYIKLGLEHLLNDNMFYKELNKNPLQDTINLINNELTNLNNHGHISDKLWKLLKLDKCKLGKFNVLPKLHKTKFGIRPIIASINHPTSKICLLMDLILQNFVKKSESYLKDSQNLIQKSKNIKLDKDTEIYSCDFESLYTNINSNDAINLIMDYLSKNFVSYNIDNVGLFKILNLIFFNNVFEFNNRFFIQVNGIGMGIKCGPSIANLYLIILETNWLTIQRPLMYSRFIDDIFLAIKGKLDEIAFKNIFKNLKLNVVKNKKVQFLDLYIQVNDLSHELDFSLYVKPTNTFQYLQFDSNHPTYIFDNLPKSLFIRIRRICTSYVDFLFHSRELILNLLKRGYDFNHLIKIFIIVSRIERNSLIDYKIKNDNNLVEKDLIRFKMTYDHNYFNLKSDVINSFKCLKNNYKWLNNLKIQFSNTIMPNLKLLLINNFRFNLNMLFFTKKCNNCFICNFIYNVSHIKLNSNFYLPLKNNCNCNSKQIVYIIKCLKCNIFYIGESEDLVKNRIKQHINSIKRFVPYQTGNLVVAEHFRLKGHNIFEHFKFCIFNKNLERSTRLSTEIDLINLFRQFSTILNIKPSPDHLNFNLIKTLSFI